MKLRTVLSLFDGMSCGRLALDRVGIEYDKYCASEIDKHAIRVATHNYPDTIELGDINNWKEWSIDWSQVDLILAGSPCQGFSFAGKQLAFDDPRSKLFFVFVDILNHVKAANPKVKFLLENVVMKQEFQEIITQQVGVEPVLINSALVSAQNRKRLYWANWHFEQPQDKGILLKDIVHEGEKTETFLILQKKRGNNPGGIRAIDSKTPCMSASSWQDNNHLIILNENIDTALSGNYAEWFAKNAEFQLSKKYCSLNPEKAITMTARQYANWNVSYWFERLSEYIVPFDKTLQILDKEVQRGKVGYFRKDSQGNRVYTEEEKSACLNASSGGTAGAGNILFGCITPDRVEKRQNGQRFNDGKKFYTLTAQDKHGVLIEGYIRKLTPIECERLQTVLQYIKQVEIVLCSDQAKSFVDAVEKNPKLLKLVSSAESEELREYVRRANQSTSASLASTKHTALQNADMQTQTQTEKCTNINRDGLNLIASSVENTTTYEQVENVESSVTQTVFINITEGRITHYGKEESRLTEQNYTELMNGKIALNLCGGETMENAKDALSALEMMQTNQHSTSITSFRLSTKNIEQMLIISHWFAKSAIDGFIQDTTSKKSLYLNLIDGYTAHVSNTQRYRMLGNGWTVDVIAHIFSFLSKNEQATKQLGLDYA